MLQAHYQQMHRGEIESWVTAADAVNAVLDTARKQYAGGQFHELQLKLSEEMRLGGLSGERSRCALV